MVVLEYLYARWLRMEIAHNTPCVVGKLYRINQVTKLLEKSSPKVTGIVRMQIMQMLV